MKQENGIPTMWILSGRNMVRIAAIVATLLPSLAMAGLTVDPLESCVTVANEGYPNDSYVASYILNVTATPTTLSFEELSYYSASNPSVVYGVCDIGAIYYMDDTPDVPTGQTPPTVPSNNLFPILFPNGMPHIHYTPYTGSPRVVTPTSVAGHRDFAISGGGDLTTGTPGYVSFLAGSLNQTTYIPFVVNSAGTDSSLSIYGPGGVLWSQSLASFTPGVLYFAAIGAQAPDSVTQVPLTYWLHSPTSGTSDVYFPDQVADANPAIGLTKTASIGFYSTAGTLVSYSYEVTNSGDVELDGVTVTDPMVGLSSVSCPSGTLSAGVSETCTATYTTTQADVDAGSINNVGAASGAPSGGTNVTATASLTIPAVQSPGIALVKTANVANYAVLGTTVTYSYTVTNNGNVDLNPVTVTDPMSGLSAISCPSGSLTPGASETCTATYTTTQTDVDSGSITNTGKATGTAPSGSNVVATSSVTISASDTPSISVVKSASIASFSTAGTLVTYTYNVTNAGNVDLNPVTVADPMSGLSAMTCSATLLAPNASLTCTATYTTTTVDVTTGSMSNTATVTGKPEVGSSATATSTLTIAYVVPANFTLSAASTSVTIMQGNAGTSPITTTVSSGFNSAISLSASGQPTGVIVSFNPVSIAAPGSGSTTMSITVGPTAAPGIYPISVIGTSRLLKNYAHRAKFG